MWNLFQGKFHRSSFAPDRGRNAVHALVKVDQKRPTSAVATPHHGGPGLSLAGEWRVELTCPEGEKHFLDVPPLEALSKSDERVASLPGFQGGKDGWLKGWRLEGVRAEECTMSGALLPRSLVVKSAPGRSVSAFVRGSDYDYDPVWGTVWRLNGGAIGPEQEVFLDYSFAPQRIDSAVVETSGRVVLKSGIPHIAMPEPPDLREGESRLVNIHLPGPTSRLRSEDLFPVLETTYPEERGAGRAPAEDLLPRTMRKLRVAERLRILAWGDSVTGYNRYQTMFVEWLRGRFPSAVIELVTVAWLGKSSVDFLAAPAGSKHDFAKRVLAAKPNLIISEFVNDASLGEGEAEILERHTRLLAAFRDIGAEWIILTPHYVRPDWMGLTSQRGIDDDPRLYVRVLREFARENRIALADASRRYGRLWRQGIPFLTLMENGINHPNAFGHRLLAESLISLFAGTSSMQNPDPQPQQKPIVQP